jgi:hypothetical protein
MSIVRTLSLSLLLAARLAIAQTPNPTVRLQGYVISVKYCEGDGEVSISQHRVRLRFTNVSRQPLILYRAYAVKNVVIGKSVTGGAIAEVETQFSLTGFTSVPTGVTRYTWPNPAFVLLQHGHFFSSEDIIPIPIRLRENNSAGLTAGEHFMQFRASPLSEDPPEVTQQLRERWRRRGLLRTGSVLSSPIRFTVAKVPGFEKCD